MKDATKSDKGQISKNICLIVLKLHEDYKLDNKKEEHQRAVVCKPRTMYYCNL